MKTKAFFLSLFAMAMLTACNHDEAVKDGGYIEENQNESEQEMQTEDTLDNIMKCLDEEVPEIVEWVDYVEKKSGGEAYLYEYCDQTVWEVYRNGEGSEYLGEYYLVYVGEMWEDHSACWSYFYVSVNFDEVLWKNIVWGKDEFETYTLEEWRNLRYYPTLNE